MRFGTSTSVDVVVIGAGIVGASVACELARDGARVAVVEQREDWAAACSWGNAGLVCPSFSAPIASPANIAAGLRWLLHPDAPFGLRLRPSLARWVAGYLRAATPARFARGEELLRGLSLESLRMILALDEELELGIVQRGCVVAYGGADGDRRAAAEAGGSVGQALHARPLDAAEVAALVPPLRAATGGVEYPLDAHCDPVRATRAIGAAAVQRGAVLHPGTAVVGLDVGPREVHVRTTSTTFVARDLVVAAGAWSGQLAEQVGVRLPMQGGKGFALEYDAAALALDRPVYLHDERCVATPMGDRLRVTGGLLLHGLDESIPPRRVGGIRRAVRTAFGLQSPPRLVWSGLRPCTPDGLPVIGRHPKAERVVFATGHGMLGLTLGPLTGRAVADVVGERPCAPEIAALSPARFSPAPAEPYIRPA